MDAPTKEAIRSMATLATVLRQLPQIAAQAYATGSYGAEPIVARHFTAGNQQRYGWAPLSRDYAREKAAGIVTKGKTKAGPVGVFLDREERSLGKRHQRELARSRRGSVLDQQAEFQSSTGTMMGIGTAPNLPMLVRSGDLRDAVTRGQHRIVQQGDVAVITFDGLPTYAIYHETGAGHNPRRSPVEPNAEDIQRMTDAVTKALTAAIGTGGDIPLNQFGRARVV